MIIYLEKIKNKKEKSKNPNIDATRLNYLRLNPPILVGYLIYQINNTVNVQPLVQKKKKKNLEAAW